mgnify:CR=1 FL=1
MLDPRWVALSLNLGGKTFRTLLAHFQHDLDAIFAADEPELRQVRGIGQKISQAILTLNMDQITQRMEHWFTCGVQIATWNDEQYPASLKQLDDAPPSLFYRGALHDDAHIGYAIVGTRNPTQTALEESSHLGSMLAQQGHIVISGLAYGVDKSAHIGALAVEGVTYAILGSGILNVYPQQHEPLAEAILGYKGALICEVAPDAPVSTAGLVARNRLIIGMSEALIMVESAIDGGAMHTVRFAKQQNKPVYTLPLSASGNQAILQDGGLDISLFTS